MPAPCVNTAKESSASPESERVIEAIVAVDVEQQLPGAHWPVALERVLGRSPVQRHLYQLEKSGLRYCAVVFVGPDAGRAMRECSSQMDEIPLGSMAVALCDGADALGALEQEQLADQGVFVRGEAVYDKRLYEAVWSSATPVELVDATSGSGGGAGASADTAIGMEKMKSGSLLERLLTLDENASVASDDEGRSLHIATLPTYVPHLRRDLAPYWCVLRDWADHRRAERLLLDSAQKGVLDFPARFIHPAPENLLARWAAKTVITPNHITVFTILLAFFATYFFAKQSFGLGLAVALVVNVLDGVDGKLARVKLLASKVGDKLDHIGDVIFEFSWYVGLGWGLSQLIGESLPLWLGIGLIVAMLTSRALSGVYELFSGRQIHDHRAFDRAFRLVGGRRNIYVFILLVGWAMGDVVNSFYVVFGWAVTTVIVYSLRTLMALFARAAHAPVGSKRDDFNDL